MTAVLIGVAIGALLGATFVITQRMIRAYRRRRSFQRMTRSLFALNLGQPIGRVTSIEREGNGLLVKLTLNRK